MCEGCKWPGLLTGTMGQGPGPAGVWGPRTGTSQTRALYNSPSSLPTVASPTGPAWRRDRGAWGGTGLGPPHIQGDASGRVRLGAQRGQASSLYPAAFPLQPVGAWGFRPESQPVKAGGTAGAGPRWRVRSALGPREEPQDCGQGRGEGLRGSVGCSGATPPVSTGVFAPDRRLCRSPPGGQCPPRTCSRSVPRPGSPSSCFSGEGEGPRLGLQPPSLSGAGAEVMERGCLA